MQEWIIEHTSVTKKQYEERLNPKVMEVSNNKEANVIEEFIKNYKTFRFQNKSLAKKLNIISTSYGYEYQNIPFQILSNVYPYDKEILRSENRKLVGYWIAYVLMRQLESLNAHMVVAKVNKVLKVFVIAQNQVYDYHNNLMMPKEFYYQIYQVEEIRVFSKEEYEKLHQIFVKNQDKLKIKSNDVTFLEYVNWPEEINEGVLKLVREKDSITFH